MALRKVNLYVPCARAHLDSRRGLMLPQKGQRKKQLCLFSHSLMASVELGAGGQLNKIILFI